MKFSCKHTTTKLTDYSSIRLCVGVCIVDLAWQYKPPVSLENARLKYRQHKNKTTVCVIMNPSCAKG